MKQKQKQKVETLDYYVVKALDFIKKQGNLTVKLPKRAYTLVVGSQSGLLAGRIIYRFAGRSFSHAKEVLAQPEIDAKRKIITDVTIVSASGSRQVIPIASYALEKGFRVNAITCRKKSKLKAVLGNKIKYIVLPTTEEPPTVNTVTYGMMIQAITHENVSKIKRVVKSLKEPKGGYGRFKAFTVIFTDRMPEVAEMVDWKLRGEKIGRCIGTMSTHLTNFMHGAGVNDAKKKKELYIALGLSKKEKRVFDQVFEKVPEERKHYIDVPNDFGPLGYMMVGYSVVGQIQKNYPDFQKKIGIYAQRAKEWEWLSPLCDKK